jgi:hypothetical protein
MARMWRTKHGFASARRIVGMELSEHLVCSRRVLLFFDTPLSNGQRLRYERSRMLVWSSTTWSLRVSALIQCMMIFHMIGRGLSPKLIIWCQPVWKFSSIEIRNQDVHQQLRDDLVAHLWVRRWNTEWVLIPLNFSNFNLFSLLHNSLLFDTKCCMYYFICILW